MRFTVRDLLWLIVVVGMGFAWFSHARDMQRQSKQRGDELLKLELVRAQRALEALRSQANSQ